MSESGSALEPGIHTDLRDRQSYAGYLALDKVLDAQHPLSEQHDEMLFIIIHQSMELWMKLMLHEIEAARTEIIADRLRPAFKMLARVARIRDQMIQAWDVLSTLTPADYEAFRGVLGQASGLQSLQYRMLDFVLGRKQADYLRLFAHDAPALARLNAALERPSLYDEVLRLLARRGIAIADDVLERDWRQPYRADPSVVAAWAIVYRDTEGYWDLYELAEKLVDLEDSFQVWRFRHISTVERIIGLKPGTGGSSGVPYLRRGLSVPLFPELLSARTEI